MIDVILLERVERLGALGQVVRVKPGFARNFLLPQKKALRATKANLEVFEQQRSQLEAQNAKKRAEAEAEAKKLEGLEVVLVRQASESGQLYGSVTGRDVSEAAKDKKVTIERSMVEIPQAIRSTGIYQIRVKLHPEVQVLITVNVARTEEEARDQMKKSKEPKPADIAPVATKAPADEKAEAAGEEGNKKPRAKKAKSEEASDEGAAEEKPKKKAAKKKSEE